MEKQYKYRFANNGRPYEISIGNQSNSSSILLYDGNLSVRDDDVISVELICQKVLLLKKYTILVKYLVGSSFDKTECSREIAVATSEVESAKEVCAEVSDMICHLKETKEAYRREQEKKSRRHRKKILLMRWTLMVKTLKFGGEKHI